MSKTLYPNIDDYTQDDKASAPPLMEDGGLVYRMTKISEMENFLRDEISQYNKCVKKFKRFSTTTRIIEISLKTSTIILEGSAIACISTGVGLPIGIILGGLGLAESSSTLATQKMNKLFDHKKDKNIKIQMLASTKLDSIIGTISKSLSDGRISDDEFKRMLSEISRYRLMKDDIRRQMSKRYKITDMEKEVFKKSLMENVLKHLNKKKNE